MNVIKDELTSGQLYYRAHREKNKQAVRNYRRAHPRKVSQWNRAYYVVHRDPKTRIMYGDYAEIPPYKPRHTYKRFDPHHYVDTETFNRNWRDLYLYYLLHFTNKLSVYTYKAFYRDFPTNHKIDWERLTG